MHGVGVFEYASVGDDLRSQVYICPIEHGPGKMKQDLSFIAAMPGTLIRFVAPASLIAKRVGCSL